MVKIRLRRVGAKKQAHYRVVVADSHSPRDGRHIEVIGYYNPRTEPETVNIKEDRALYWLGKGAQPTESVLRFLKKQGTLTRLTRLKAGESFEALIAEYETSDTEAEPVAEAKVEASAEAEVVEAEGAEIEVAKVEVTEDDEASSDEPATDKVSDDESE